ncbi:MAG: aldolase [Desulfuromonas sp.]|nr:MAG: aldolase [Desulfuromonas sp.]
MIRQVEKYLDKMQRDRIGKPGGMALVASDDTVIGQGNDALQSLGSSLLERLDLTAVALVEPTFPFTDYLVVATPTAETRITPRDTETRTFLHDIPILRSSQLSGEPADRIAELLGQRKGVLVEGVGIIAAGSITVEQAYINASSLFHSLLVMYLLDLLTRTNIPEQELQQLDDFRRNWLKPLVSPETLLPGKDLNDPTTILQEMSRVGRITVELGLVDSFFGNISCRFDNTLYISQTAASLDELEGCIDPVPFDNSSTCGITASSELLAHRLIYEQTGARTLLHGHPRFAVIMSMLCDTPDCPIDDCWRDCPHTRLLGNAPVVAGEVGAGGLARRVAPIIGDSGKAVVYGHGIFAIGRDGFDDALNAMIETEEWCRREYFRRLDMKISNR